LTNPYFQSELNTLNEDAPEFSRANPTHAPLLDGNKTDPDVERLLESLAFLVAMLRQKLAFDLPKMIQMLVQLVLPQFLRPIPAITTLCFTSHATGGQSVIIPAGARFASVPVDGRKCIFTTSTDIEIHPLELTDVAFVQHAGRAGEIRLSLSLKGLSLSRWQPATPLRLRLTGDFASATELFQLLNLHLGRIVLTPADGGVPVALPLDCLKPAGEDEELLPYPSNVFPGYQWLQEYFNSPEKFLAFDLDLRAYLPQLGDGTHFTISFILDSLPSGPPRISPGSFTLNTVMAINLFPHDADPISLDHRSGSYLIRPAGQDSAHCQVYSVDQVTGYTRATAEERDYLPFDLFDDSGSEPIYQTLSVKSHNGYDVYLEVAYPGEMPLPDTETLSIALTCTNGSLPENLHIGDITEPLTALPDFITARNITPVTPGQPPPLDPGLLQKLISHLCMNHLSLESVEHLTTLLKLYASLHNSGTAATANLKRIAGIVALEVTAGEQMVQGIPMRGREIRIKVRQDHFAGAGDMYLFGCMLDRFLGGYSATNTYTRLSLNETTRGVIYRWPMRLGNCTQPGLIFEPKRTQPANKIGRRSFNTKIRQAGMNTTSLIDDLVLHGHEYSYSQVMSIARRVFGPGGKEHIPGVPWQKRVHIRPDLSLAFPPSDVARVERDGTDLLVATTFLGLYGSSSPMPTFYSEDLMLLESTEDSSVTRCFIDIFHQRMYLRFFECVSKYRLFNRIGEEKNLADLVRLHCLNGLGEKELRDAVPESRPMLRNIGLLNQFPRSALGLQTMLRDAMDISCLMVEQCVLRKVPIPVGQRMSLGLSGMSLGVNTVLGKEIQDRTGKIRIHIGPLKKVELNSFFPGTPLYDKLERLIRLYLIDPLEYDLKLILAAGEARPIRLGDPNGARLGFGTWCFSYETLGEVSITFPIAQHVAQAHGPEDDFGYPTERTEPQSLVDYYKHEMANLRDLIARYVEKYPGMAPMFSGNIPDQGVERTMEGDAYLGARVQQKLDDDLPEVIHGVTEVVQPNSLKSTPATTTVVFTPNASCMEPQIIPAGTELKSVPVDGTECRFTTCYPVEIHPLAITDVSFAQPSGKPAAITLSLKLTGIALSNWKVNKLRLFLAGERKHASNLYLVLVRYVKRIVITPLQGGHSIVLDSSHLKAAGFEDTDALFPNGTSGSACYQLIQEFFIQPCKFLIIDLHGWEKWRERGEGSEFEISFELDKLPFALHQVSFSDFALFATLVVNVFKHQAEPIILDVHRTPVPVRPLDAKSKRYQLYSLERVYGRVRFSPAIKTYIQAAMSAKTTYSEPTYQVIRHKSSLNSGLDTFVSVFDEPGSNILPDETLYIDLLCTNGRLPDTLQPGDICIPTGNSPNFATFSNCKPVSAGISSTTENNQLWKLLALSSLNLGQLTTKSLWAILERTAQIFNCDHATAKLHANRIKGITDLRIESADRVFGRSVVRGWEIRIMLNSEAYSSFGEMYLFGSLLDHFLRGFATQLCYTRTTVEDVNNLTTYEWPAKLGRRPLL
jgi:type VI secretion system protein ImpG